ncbi:hypothetical protein AAC387_Pa04g1953 [Persea americana]
MGCGGSKLDDSDAVAFCKGRSQLLEDAIRHRYSLAQSHLAYLHSLKSVACSLQRFFDLDQSAMAPSSPFLPLPTQRKGDPDPGPAIETRSPELIKPSSSSPPIVHSHSNSGSHLHFQSGSDSDASGSPFHDHDHEIQAPSPPRYYMNYARSGGPAASISYEQRPQSPEKIHFGGSSYFPSPSPSPSTSYSYQYPYSNYGGVGGLLGSLPQYSYSSSPPRQAAAAARAEPSGEEAAPPPPPPPNASTWDFFNPFESVEYYPIYTPSRDSKELREEEGIPDLEDEYQQEVVKEVYGEQKFVAAEKGGGGGDERSRGIGGEVEYGVRSSAVGESSGVEYGVHLVDKNVIANEKPPVESHGNVAPAKGRGPWSDSEAVSAIKEQFVRASDSGSEVSKILEVGKLPYCGKNSVYKVSSRMLDVITISSQPSNYKGTDALPIPENVDLSIDFEEDMWVKSKGLSSTLEKLYIWEKKLYEEIKVEEKMRMIHEKKCMRLKDLDERGAEAHKIESTRTLVRKLSTKIRIAFHFVDSISSKISKLRDEDLWPQIAQLIQGLLGMWKLMLECHQRQCQIITEANNLNAVASSRKLSDAHMEATMQLEQDLMNWILSFYAWVSAQKSYVKALNSWLLKCIHYEPEVTPDGVVPFSPGRIGAPPVFVICNHWFQVMDRIKDNENEVFDAMWAFSDSVLKLWDEYHLEQRQRMMANKDMDRRLKLLEKEEQKMRKALDIVNKKLALVSEQNGLTPPEQIMQRGTNAGVQSGLKQIFESMERFSSICMGAYEELHLRCEEVRLSWENAKVP